MHSVTRRFFNWCVSNDLIASSPVTGIKAPNKKTSRDRVLTDDELRLIWHAADGLFGSIVKLLILTGQRRSEVTQMEWAELDLVPSFGRCQESGRKTTADTKSHCRIRRWRLSRPCH